MVFTYYGVLFNYIVFSCFHPSLHIQGTLFNVIVFNFKGVFNSSSSTFRGVFIHPSPGAWGVIPSGVQ